MIRIRNTLNLGRLIIGPDTPEDAVMQHTTGFTLLTTIFGHLMMAPTVFAITLVAAAARSLTRDGEPTMTSTSKTTHYPSPSRMMEQPLMEIPKTTARFRHSLKTVVCAMPLKKYPGATFVMPLFVLHAGTNRRLTKARMTARARDMERMKR